MPDQPDLSTLSDDDLTAVADKQIKVATEARIAAFAARDQTNPKKYGDLLGQTLDSHPVSYTHLTLPTIYSV